MSDTITKEAPFVPLKQIRFDDQQFNFRVENPVKKEKLKAELIKHGQIYPLALLETDQSEYIILDGHLRGQIIREIQTEENRWESVVANLHRASEFSLKDQFQLLCQANMVGDFAYGPVEKGRCFAAFNEKGLPKLEMAELAGITLNDVDELISLTEAPAELYEMLNKSTLPSYFSHQLVKSVLRWKGTEFEKAATTAAREILVRTYPGLSPYVWQFLLDFYLGPTHPFRGLSKIQP